MTGFPRTICTALWLNISLPTVTTSADTLGLGYHPGPNGSVTIRVPLLVVIRKKLCPKYWIVASTLAAWATEPKPSATSGSRQAECATEWNGSTNVKTTAEVTIKRAISEKDTFFITMHSYGNQAIGSRAKRQCFRRPERTTRFASPHQRTVRAS